MSDNDEPYVMNVIVGSGEPCSMCSPVLQVELGFGETCITCNAPIGHRGCIHFIPDPLCTTHAWSMVAEWAEIDSVDRAMYGPYFDDEIETISALWDFFFRTAYFAPVERLRHRRAFPVTVWMGNAEWDELPADKITWDHRLRGEDIHIAADYYGNKNADGRYPRCTPHREIPLLLTIFHGQVTCEDCKSPMPHRKRRREGST